MYHVENSIFDLGIIARNPIDPGKILVNLSIFDYTMEKKARQLVCLAIEVTITQAKSSGSVIRKSPTKTPITNTHVRPF